MVEKSRQSFAVCFSWESLSADNINVNFSSSDLLLGDIVLYMTLYVT